MPKPMDSYEIRRQFKQLKDSIEQLEVDLNEALLDIKALQKKTKKPPVPRGRKPKIDMSKIVPAKEEE